MKFIISRFFRSGLIGVYRPLRRLIGPTRTRKLRESFGRGKAFDEISIISNAIAKSRKGTGMMVDVGAHNGEAFLEFAENRWLVHCFEPNMAHHDVLKKWGSYFSGRVLLFPLAVSDNEKFGLDFFLSSESSGISSLHQFHESHRYAFKVDTTTLARHFEKHRVEHVDLLKIDTEGHDLFVLKGIDWEKTKPDVVVCEFEDRKTVALGYNFHDLATFLTARGYKVIVSEWFPIERYGANHKWRRFMNYPCELESSKAWGNLIAIKEHSDFIAIRKEIEAVSAVN